MVEDTYPTQLVTQLCSQLAQLENFNLHLISTQLGSWLASQTSFSKTAPYCQQQNRRSPEFSLLFHFRFRFVSYLAAGQLTVHFNGSQLASQLGYQYLHHEVEQLQLAAQLASQLGQQAKMLAQIATSNLAKLSQVAGYQLTFVHMFCLLAQPLQPQVLFWFCFFSPSSLSC